MLNPYASDRFRKGPGMIDAILFDLADTLLNFDELRPRRLFSEAAKDSYRYLKGLGFSLPDFKAYSRAYLWAFGRRIFWSSIRNRDYDCINVMVAVLKQLNIRLSEDEYRTTAWTWYESAARRSHVDRGTHRVLGHLRRQGIKMAIISNTLVPACCLDRHLKGEGLLEFFPIRIYSSAVRYKKPHPAIFRMALEELKVRPERAIFVGDSLKRDIRGAQRAGLAAIWKTGGRQIKAGGCGADGIIQHIGDLPHILTEFGVREWSAA